MVRLFGLNHQAILRREKYRSSCIISARKFEPGVDGNPHQNQFAVDEISMAKSRRTSMTLISLLKLLDNLVERRIVASGNDRHPRKCSHDASERNVERIDIVSRVR